MATIWDRVLLLPLVESNQEIAQAGVNLGVQLSGFVVHADLRSARRYVLRHLEHYRRSSYGAFDDLPALL